MNDPKFLEKVKKFLILVVISVVAGAGLAAALTIRYSDSNSVVSPEEIEGEKLQEQIDIMQG